MWQDLKRAEENVVTPSSSKHDEPSPTRLQKYKRAASDARLDTLLQTLQAEVATPSRREESAVKQQKESRLQRHNSMHSASSMSPVSEDGRESGSLSRRSRTSRPSTPSSHPSPESTVPSVPLSDFEKLQQEK
ncbi:hypothetical protein GN244_ATG00626 [Phytophthora infestans]|uniref:Uncharacterized protein n=1 Tax=Phytophthora infestans TaxID=4787 RepID=A0A833SE35_PHYIN|nr:hypothetical protein GN244_ATG00626 [Phytophthora infestans]KAF4145266.1 hypothetical protein GN958_ATG05568 [Phytophthora infestans]